MAFPAGCEKNASASNPSASNQFKMVVWAACVVLGSNPVRNNSKEPYQPSLVQWRKDITELQRAAVREANDLKRKQTTAQRDTKKKPNTAHTVLVAVPVHDGVLAATTPLVAETAATLVDAFAADVLPGSQL